MDSECLCGHGRDAHYWTVAADAGQRLVCLPDNGCGCKGWTVDSGTDRLTEAGLGRLDGMLARMPPSIGQDTDVYGDIRRLIAEVRQWREHECATVDYEHVRVPYQPPRVERTCGTVDHARKRTNSSVTDANVWWHPEPWTVEDISSGVRCYAPAPFLDPLEAA